MPYSRLYRTLLILIANRTPDVVLNGNSKNAPHVLFSFLGANTDKQDRVRCSQTRVRLHFVIA